LVFQVSSGGKFEDLLFNKTVKSNNTDCSEDGLLILTPCMLSYDPTLILYGYQQDSDCSNCYIEWLWRRRQYVFPKRLNV